MNLDPTTLAEGVVERATGGTGSADVLTLNVGGERLVATLRSTLTVAAGSKLAESFSGRWDANLPRDRDENFFVDQRPELFVPLLDFLRDLSAMTPPGAHDDVPPLTPAFDRPREEASFRRMVDALDLTNALYNYEIYRFDNSPEIRPERLMVSRQCSVLEFALKAEAPQTIACYLLDRARGAHGDCHGRRIQAFEVKLGPDFIGTVGWVRRHRIFTRDEAVHCRECPRIDLETNIRSLNYWDYHARPARVRLEDLIDLNENSIIQCRKSIETGDLQWHVNGVLVASTCRSLGLGETTYTDTDAQRRCLRLGWSVPDAFEMIPCVRVMRGECRFSTFELEA